jgi:Alpha galactosidase A C-terminal beta sandwich domain
MFFTLTLLTNDEVIAVNQDALGKQAVPVVRKDGIEIWEKDMEDGSRAIALFNRGSRAPARFERSVLGPGQVADPRSLEP